MAIVPRMSREELKRRLDDTVGAPPLLIDVRLKYPYEHSTITLPGALRMGPGSTPDDGDASLPRDRDLILYDSDPDELVAERIAARLIERGCRAYVLQGGIGAWAAAKLPTDTKQAPQLAVPVTAAMKR
jgi:rhodanese-related sulfurtransferase